MKKLSKWFSYAECVHSDMAARRGIKNVPTPVQLRAMEALCLTVLDAIRNLCGKAIVPFSMFRNEQVNILVGGSKKSQHMKGEACDFLPAGMTVKDTMKLVLTSNIPFDQLIDEFGSWVHISYTERRNRGMVLVYRMVNGIQRITQMTRQQAIKHYDK